MGRLFKATFALVSLAVLAACAGSTRSPKSEPASGRPAAESFIRWRAALLQAEDTGRANEALREGLASETVERRRAAVRALGFIRDSSMTDEFVTAFADPVAEVRAEAIVAAGLSGSSDVLPAIVAHRKDSDKLVRSAVAVALGRFATPESIAPLAELIGDENKDVRRIACYSAARQTGAGELVDPLLQVAEDPHAEISAAAVYALSRLSARFEALEFSDRFRIRQKFVQMARSRDPGIQILVAEGLHNPLPGEQADTLHAMMTEIDQPQVLAAIIRSTSIPGAPTFVFHEVMIKHKNPLVVQGTLVGLGRMKGEAVNRLLLNFIIEDSRGWLRADAIRSLALADSRTMLQVANGLSTDPGPLIRAATAETLYGREEPEAATYARRLFETEDAWVRLYAIPSMASVAEPLGSVFGNLLGRATLEEKVQMMRAVGYRLGMSGRSETDHADAMALLGRLWKQALAAKAPEMQLAAIEAAAVGQREDGAVLIRKALKSGDLGVRRRAASILGSSFNEKITLDPPEDKPFSYYEDIIAWAARQHAAVITVERPGFVPGRFTLALDSKNAPMTSWRFARLAARGHYDNRRIDPFRPGLRFHSGRGGGNRYGDTSWRAEAVFSLFAPGTVAAVGLGDALLGEWTVVLGARPHYLGRYSPFAVVVQNLAGVVGNILPIDRVVSVRVYEGNGREELPPLQ